MKLLLFKNYEDRWESIKASSVVKIYTDEESEEGPTTIIETDTGEDYSSTESVTELTIRFNGLT